MLKLAHRQNPSLQPTSTDSKTPPSIRPTKKPKGIPSPKHAKPTFLALPPGIEAIRILVEVGKHIEIPMP